MKRADCYLLISLILCLLTFPAQAGIPRSLSFQQRVQAQTAIERVYYEHRLWPAENPGPKPQFEQAVPGTVIRDRVEDYIRKSAALELYWKRTITGEELQQELERMVGASRDPAMLKEIFSALGNDPFIIAECLIRPILAEKLLCELYYSDREMHSDVYARAENFRASLKSSPFCEKDGGRYERIVFINEELAPPPEHAGPEGSQPPVLLGRSLFEDLFSAMPPDGSCSKIVERDDRFVIFRTIGKNFGSIELESVSFYKIPLDDWLAGRPLSQGALLEIPVPDFSFQIFSDAFAPGKLLDCTPEEGFWSTISSGTNTPAGRQLHSAVWTGTEMIVWGGVNTTSLRTGGRYFPATDSWLPTSTGTNTPAARYYHSAVWTGTEMIIWGSGSNTGGRFNPATNMWSLTSQGTNCPSSRTMHTAVWTGTEMIIWGGSYNTTKYNSGGRYVPSSNSWSLTSTGTNVPSPRSQHTAVWTGTEMIVWGGRTSESNPFFTSTGARYSPASDSWTATTNNNAPEQRAYHTAVWSGEVMIIWGGIETSGNFRIFTGSRYSPATDAWMPTPESDFFPEARSEHTAVWGGGKMIVWGGHGAIGTLNSGAFYDPAAGTWLATSTGSGVPTARSQHTAVWTGEMMIVWGGYSSQNSGGILFGGPATPLFPGNNSAADEGCSDTGVTVTWRAPLIWGDSGVGTRTFEVLRDGTVAVTGLSEATLSYTDVLGDNEVSYLYQVRAVNGCGLSSLTAGVSAADHAGDLPVEVAFLNMTGYSWDIVAEATSYRLYMGTLADLPNLMTSTPDGCARYEGPLTSCADCGSDDPSTAVGKMQWYLVTALFEKCEGSSGNGTGFTRVISSTGKCGD